MRIKFKKVIRLTNTDPSALLRNIIDELNGDGYEITNQTQSGVEFKHNVWGFGSRTEAFKKVDGGIFEIISEKKAIVFSYYLSPLFEILAFCVVTFFGIIRDHFILLFLIVLAVMFIVRLVSVKMAGDRIIESVLNTELSQS